MTATSDSLNTPPRTRSDAAIDIARMALAHIAAHAMDAATARVAEKALSAIAELLRGGDTP